jgi:Icc-related predicted phosphoesterase
VRLVLISDTHTFHDQVQLPGGDVLVHAGDMGLRGTVREAQACLNWLNRQPFAHVVAIAGNHDWAFAKPELKSRLDLGRIQYLENSHTVIEGKVFYGSPVQPEFCNWAFNVPRGPEIKKFWDKIPEHTDVLITHGPPFGIGDQVHLGYSDCLGCADLFEAVDRIDPEIHVFGHIHGGYSRTQYGAGGTQFFNASQCDEAYRVKNLPWTVDI